MTTKTLTTAAAAAILGAALAACGSSTTTTSAPAPSGHPATATQSTPAPSPTTTRIDGWDYPYCADVWQVGKTLPANYGGCANGSTVEAATTVGSCELTTYKDMYAPAGKTIAAAKGALANDPGYRKTYLACNR